MEASAPPAVLSDPARLEALRATALIDSPPEEAFDRLTRLASHALRVPVALVSLVGEDRQFFKSCVGVAEPWASERGTPLSHSFCQHAVASGEPLVIEDARDHPLVRENLGIRDLDVIAYAGVPLIRSRSCGPQPKRARAPGRPRRRTTPRRRGRGALCGGAGQR